ncbi:hypothetical protein ASZ90_018299 [hydrocarbon metagenome]|uniref:Radical SAM core domain-containing protein n=1 Tax=hydrocarbon metagenome TaxID=938273 RepID=A0A0W8E6N5_9ZZZZ
MPEGALKGLMGAVRQYLELDDAAEISLEANPATLNSDKLRSIREAGFNRISLGVQSFQDDDLLILGRSHNAGDAMNTIKLIQDSGISNYNLDLIYGIPGQTISKWEESLGIALEAKPAHLSIYLLQLDESTPLSADIRRGCFEMSGDEIEAQMYEKGMDLIKAGGFRQYEISNFSRPGYECQHNLLYWKAREYIGVGAGAVSFTDNRRYINKKNLMQYLQRLEEGREPPVELLESMDQLELAADAIILGLRLCDGIDLEQFDLRYGIKILDYYKDIIEECMDRGLLEICQGRIGLSSKAYFISNQVLCHFTA